ATIAGGIQTIERFLPECDGSTLVVLEYGGNDCNYNWKAVSENPEGSHSCAVPPEEYVNLMKKAIGMLKSRGSSVMISTLAPIHSEPFLDFISQGLSKRGILRWLGKVERLGQWQAYYSELAQKVAQGLDCPLLPLRKAAMAVDWEKFLCADGIHPTEEGHRVLNAFAVRELTSFCCI
ncbi:MAG: SGNH/GDSL hydrolase family protein, partial [Oscillospiraceae bacterium]|nr:SGNH/GDSL hydrolase family protein [Oscillospiraceae bacterium]